MSSQDVIISMDQATLNKAIAVLYGRPDLRSRLFSGTRTLNVAGVDTTAGWEVLQPPALRVEPPSDQQWANAVKQDDTAARPEQNAFLLHFPQLKVLRKLASGGTQEATLPVDAICTVAIRDNRVALDAVAVILDLSSAPLLDQFFYRAVIIPQVLQMADTALSGLQIPALDFKGVKFGPAVLSAGSGRIVAGANLEGKPPPAAPQPSSMPPGAFYVLLSREALQQLTNVGARGMVGTSAQTSGSKGFGVGQANYSGSIRLDSVSASPSPHDLTVVQATVGVSASASAGVDVVSAIGGAIVSGAETVGKGIATGAQAVGGAVKSVGEEIGKAFSSY